METKSFYTRQMLLQYGKQLIAARRLMRYELLTGHETEEPSNVATQRSYMVERVTKEIVENLIFSGSTNLIVMQVKAKLSEVCGEHFIFRYPPGEIDFSIFKITPEGEEELSEEKKQEVMTILWDVTRQIVDRTMI